ncbi:MAG: four helix bundle suffix domain-containing protein, partial [Kiritimatiellia bacterium]|nr:four helix bundle suffix domain-containing protein [Kiritimatiellia bacterium]
HGGYRKLDSFTLASVIQLGTWRFCETFLNRRNDPCGRQFDQMTQAARSGRANIAEGSERAATSKETEMKLTDVARASLAELKGDYEFWLLRRKLAPWPTSSTEAREVFNLRLDPNPIGEGDDLHKASRYLLTQADKFAPWLDSDDSDRAANAMLILLSRTLNMLNRQRAAQGVHFRKEGGFRERLSAVRLEERDKQPAEEGAPMCPACGKPMRKRLAKSGQNAGKPFWGCPGFPECKGTRDVTGQTESRQD